MTTYSYEDVLAALNRAADDIQVAADLPDEGALDAINLTVNATAFYLRNQDATLREAIEDCYGEEADDVLGWCKA